MFCSECGQRWEGIDRFCSTCGNDILTSCDKAQQNRNMNFQAPHSFRCINPGRSTLSVLGIFHEPSEIREQAIGARELKRNKGLGGLSAIAYGPSKTKIGTFEKNEIEEPAGASRQTEIREQAIRARELKQNKGLGGLSAIAYGPSKTKIGIFEKNEIEQPAGLFLMSGSKRKRGLIEENVSERLAGTKFPESETTAQRVEPRKRKRNKIFIGPSATAYGPLKTKIRTVLKKNEIEEPAGLFLMSGSKRKRGLIEENVSERLAGISREPSEIREQAMRARELKLKNDFEGSQGDGSNFEAYKRSGSSVPAEIRARGPKAERAFQKALQTGKVEVYRGRIMLLGQDRAGKTSLKKSLLGLPFDPNQESTVGVEVDRSRCEIEVDEVVNWMLSKRKKRKVSEFEEEMARFIARYLTESEADDDSSAIHPNVEELKRTDQLEEAHDEPTLLPDVNEPATGAEETRDIAEDSKKAGFEEKLVDKDEVSDVHHLNISSTTLRNNVTAQVMRHLQSPRLEDDIKSEEAILTLWDFAGQHLYYASHPVFLSGRAVYILVHNLNKNLLATAEPLVRQGMIEILLDNPNNETNLDNLLSWLVSVHNIRSNANTNVAHRGTKQSYLRPPVFIVGTNLDQPFEDVKTAENRIKKSVLGKDYAKHVIMPFFIVNNKAENDEGVQKLRHKIMEVLKDEPYMPEEVPLRWFNFERAVDALVAKQIYFMDLNKLLSIIRQVCHVDDEEEVKAMLNFYHDLGVIVKHGRTVVLQAQWLIDLFKQLITVRPHGEADPLYVNCWRELEVNGILRMALVDHVFSKFSKKGLRKQDILDMMELYGLIAKFSNGTDENQDEQSYFVPTQLKSSPSALCEIKPSEYDPCPLVLHFLDGFVPHGLFPQLVSKFIHWCSENGFGNTPQLFNNGARLFIGKQILFYLILICKKRFIKIVLKRRNTSSSTPLLRSDSNKMAFEVRNFIERTLDGFSRDLCWLGNLRYELSVVCTHCLQGMCSLHRLRNCCQDDCLHLLRARHGEEPICEKNFSDETISPGWEMWFEVLHTQTKEPNKDTSEAVGLDESVSFKLGTLSKDDVLLIAHELGPSWKKVALALNVPCAEINEIEADETKVFERCHAVLTCWQERYPNDATYHRLARALQHPAVGKVDLAVKYCGLQLGKDVPVAKDY